MPYPQGISIFISLLLHGLLILLLLFTPRRKKMAQKVENPMEVTFLENEEVEQKPPLKAKVRSRIKKTATPRKVAKGKRKSRTTTTQNSGKKSDRFAPFKKLSPDLYDDTYYGESNSSDSPFKGEWSDHPVMATLNSMNLPEYSENHYFFVQLRQKINQAVIYPKDLAEHKITGKIWIEILVDQQGRLLQILDKSTKQPILEAYVIVNLYQALKNPIPQRFWYSKKKELAFSLKFDFSVSSIDTTPPLHTANSQKNSMRFVRREKIPNLLEELSTDYARYFPPIVPTPVGPVINFVQVYRMINAWSDISPLQRKKMRLNLTKEKIEAQLEKVKNKK